MSNIFTDGAMNLLPASFNSRVSSEICFITLKQSEFDLLVEASSFHSSRMVHTDTSVACCWDADRLDLTRLVIQVDPARVCTCTAAAMAGSLMCNF